MFVFYMFVSLKIKKWNVQPKYAFLVKFYFIFSKTKNIKVSFFDVII